MSKVIKNSSLSSQPKVIEVAKIETYKPTIVAESSDYLNEIDELAVLEDESQKIIKETEQMVIDLLEKAQGEAREIMANAQDEADVVRSEVYAEAKQLKEESKKTGYEEGLKLANEEIKFDRERAIEQNQLIVEEARQTKLEILRSVESDIVRLVMAITKKTIVNELETNPDSIMNIVKEAINHLDNPQNVRVYVNPSEMDRLLELLENELLADIGSEEIRVDVKGDNRISSGGPLIESDSGSVDARIETKLANIEKGLLEVSGDE